MKIVSIVAIKQIALEAYLEQVKVFFDGAALVEGYAFEKNPAAIRGDIILVTSHFLFEEVKETRINRNAEIILISSTFAKEQIEQLKQIPQGEQVLVSNSYKELVYDCITQFEQLLPGRLRYLPHSIGEPVEPGCRYALRFIEPDPIPVEHVIEIGIRKIHWSVYAAIIRKHFPGNALLERRLETYRDSLVSIDFSEVESGGITSEWEGAVNRLMELFDEGVLILDGRNFIKGYNLALCGIFQIGEEEYKHGYVADIPCFRGIFQMLEQAGEGITLKYLHPDLKKMLTLKKRIVQFYSTNFLKLIFIKDTKEGAQLPKNQARFGLEDIVYQSSAMERCVTIVKKIANSDNAVLIVGETGTGKELMAQAIHRHSHRKAMPFIAVNCGAFSEALLESELFGYESGAFTGALRQGKKGIFETASGGTIFLDEVGDAPLSIQIKLLRVLQEREIRRVGGTDNIPVNIRIISATNRNLLEMIEEGKFRRDLYYRLNSFSLTVPPLRERKEDIPLLVGHFLKQSGYGYKTVTPSVMECLMNNRWEGNIRQLRNCVDYFAFMSGEVVTKQDLPDGYLPGEQQAPVSQTASEGVKETAPAWVEHPMFAALPQQERELCRFILCRLGEKQAGRSMLLREAVQKGLTVTEHQMKRAMQELAEQGLVEARTGRGGSSLTETGFQVLKQMKIG